MEQLARAIVGNYQGSDGEQRVSDISKALGLVINPLVKKIEILEKKLTEKVK